MKRKEIVTKVFYIIISIICLICYGLLGYFALKSNIIPNKYLLEGILLAIIFLGCSLFVIFTNSKTFFKVLVIVLMIGSSILSSFGSYFLSHTYDFIVMMNKEEKTISYSVVVLNNNEYERINDIKTKKIAYLANDNNNDIKAKLDRKIEFEEILVSKTRELSEMLFKKEVAAIVVEDSYLLLLNEELDGFKDKAKVLYNFEVDIKSHQEETKKIDITQDSFILYISGVDSYGNVNTSRGRSDLNILAVINPKTNHILVVYNPNDYYLTIEQDDLKEKLANTGIYGIDKSIKSLEDLYDIDINHYLKINFNDLVQVVDIIGGIDIDSDESYVINSTLEINTGKNHFSAQEALQYARFGRVSKTDDNIRVESQQQVITAILDKLTKEEVLIKDYNSILSNLEGSLETDLATNMITSLIKYQLDKAPTWYADGVAVNGTLSEEYIYSLGDGYEKRNVLIPNQDSINSAKERINSVFNETIKRT